MRAWAPRLGVADLLERLRRSGQTPGLAVNLRQLSAALLFRLQRMRCSMIVEHGAERVGDAVRFLVDASNLRADQVAHVVEPFVHVVEPFICTLWRESEMRTLLKAIRPQWQTSVMAMRNDVGVGHRSVFAMKVPIAA